MINGVLHPGQFSPSIFTQQRSAASARAATAPEASAASLAEARTAEVEQDHKALLREYQVLGLATRKFSEILPQIESLDVPIE